MSSHYERLKQIQALLGADDVELRPCRGQWRVVARWNEDSEMVAFPMRETKALAVAVAFQYAQRNPQERDDRAVG